jgi:excisionase family DNA binding protein
MALGQPAGAEAVTAERATRLAYRIDEAAELTHISRATIYRWIAKGELKTVKIGGIRLVSARVLNALIEKGLS